MILGIFDSGIGGLSLIKKLLEVGFTNFIYLKDSKNFPYGLKDKRLLYNIGKDNIKLLLEQGAQKIIIACHTMSNAASEDLRIAFPSLQIFDVLNPTLNHLRSNYLNKHILLIGTNTTIDLGIYKNMLENLNTFYEVKASDLAKAIEDNDIETTKTLILNKTTEYIKNKEAIEAVLLACTHFSLVKNLVKNYNPKITILDPIDFLFDELMKIINFDDLTIKNRKITPKYYTTQKAGPIIPFDPDEFIKLS